MKTTAAVLVETGRCLVMADLEIPALKPGQVLVEVAYSGVCHTQLLECRGYRGHDPWLPHCLGHEGSGIVMEIGGAVTKCKPGDHVVLSWIKGDGVDVPGCVYNWNGTAVNAGSITTFSTQTVVSENRVTVIPPAFDLRVAALLGCAAATGLGAVLNTASVTAGESVAVFGTGGIGLCAIAGAALAGALPVIAIDVSEERLAVARQLGAQQTINASKTDPVASIRDEFPCGIDVAIEACGRPDVMVQALSAVRSRGGRTVIIGNAHHGEHIQLNPAELNQGKRLLGTWGGDTHPDRDLPRYIRLIDAGRLDLSPLLSAPDYPLGEINRALEDLEGCRVPRPLIDMQRS